MQYKIEPLCEEEGMPEQYMIKRRKNLLYKYEYMCKGNTYMIFNTRSEAESQVLHMLNINDKKMNSEEIHPAVFFVGLLSLLIIILMILWNV